MKVLAPLLLLVCFLVSSEKVKAEDFLLSDTSYLGVEQLISEAATTGSIGGLSITAVAGVGPGVAVSAATSLAIFIFHILSKPVNWYTSKTDPLLNFDFIFAEFQLIQMNARNLLEGNPVNEEFFKVIDFMDQHCPELEQLSLEVKTKLILGQSIENIENALEMIRW